MLTLLETTDAIRAINTDADIIDQACLKVLGLTTNVTNAQELAIHLGAVYLSNPDSKLSTTDFLAGLTSALCATLAAGCREGHEIDLLRDFQRSFARSYAQSVLALMREQTKDDPQAAITRMVQLIKQFGE